MADDAEFTLRTMKPSPQCPAGVFPWTRCSTEMAEDAELSLLEVAGSREGR
jgi:hypothetical protein